VQVHQVHTLKKDDEQLPVKGNQKVFEEHQQPDENSDEEDDIVPVVIKPGHIRFERLGKGLSCVFICWVEMDSSIFSRFFSE
jgi:coilin